jgi:hypothetical protein
MNKVFGALLFILGCLSIIANIFSLGELNSIKKDDEKVKLEFSYISMYISFVISIIIIIVGVILVRKGIDNERMGFSFG